MLAIERPITDCKPDNAASRWIERNAGRVTFVQPSPTGYFPEVSQASCHMEKEPYQ